MITDQIGLHSVLLPLYIFHLHSDGPITREGGEGPAYELQGTV